MRSSHSTRIPSPARWRSRSSSHTTCPAAARLATSWDSPSGGEGRRTVGRRSARGGPQRSCGSCRPSSARQPGLGRQLEQGEQFGLGGRGGRSPGRRGPGAPRSAAGRRRGPAPAGPPSSRVRVELASTAARSSCCLAAACSRASRSPPTALAPARPSNAQDGPVQRASATATTARADAKANSHDDCSREPRHRITGPLRRPTRHRLRFTSPTLSTERSGWHRYRRRYPKGALR